MSKPHKITTNDYYALSDYLGMDLTYKNGQVTGTGTVRTNWGLTLVDMPLKVQGSFLDLSTGTVCLLIATRQDLGIGVIYHPFSGELDCHFIDRSKLDDRGEGFFTASPFKASIDVLEAFKARSVFRVQGKVGKTQKIAA